MNDKYTVPAQTRIGHVHLKVADLNRALQFILFGVISYVTRIILEWRFLTLIVIPLTTLLQVQISRFAKTNLIPLWSVLSPTNNKFFLKFTHKTTIFVVVNMQVFTTIPIPWGYSKTTTMTAPVPTPSRLFPD